jgi:hypothetical protein
MNDSTLLAYVETVIASSEIAFQEVADKGVMRILLVGNFHE